MQLAFATNSDHTEALARAADTLADVTQQLQAERKEHAATQERLRLKSAAHAALQSDAKHLKELATQSRQAGEKRTQDPF
jgi:septal ring factor EnvC (AmiA/AmiB activator)